MACSLVSRVSLSGASQAWATRPTAPFRWAGITAGTGGEGPKEARAEETRAEEIATMTM